VRGRGPAQPAAPRQHRLQIPRHPEPQREVPERRVVAPVGAAELGRVVVVEAPSPDDPPLAPPSLGAVVHACRGGRCPAPAQAGSRANSMRSSPRCTSRRTTPRRSRPCPAHRTSSRPPGSSPRVPSGRRLRGACSHSTAARTGPSRSPTGTHGCPAPPPRTPTRPLSGAVAPASRRTPGSAPKPRPPEDGCAPGRSAARSRHPPSPAATRRL